MNAPTVSVYRTDVRQAGKDGTTRRTRDLLRLLACLHYRTSDNEQRPALYHDARDGRAWMRRDAHHETDERDGGRTTPPPLPACLHHDMDDDAPLVRSDWTRRPTMRTEPARTTWTTWTTWTTSPPLPACLPYHRTDDDANATPAVRRERRTHVHARPPACLPTTSGRHDTDDIAPSRSPPGRDDKRDE